MGKSWKRHGAETQPPCNPDGTAQRSRSRLATTSSLRSPASPPPLQPHPQEAARSVHHPRHHSER